MTRESLTTIQSPPLSYAHGTDPAPLLGDTIGRNLDRAVAAHPDRDALVDVPSGRRWTYAQFGADVDELARGLLARGVLKGTGSGSGRSTAPNGSLCSTRPRASVRSW